MARKYYRDGERDLALRMFAAEAKGDSADAPDAAASLAKDALEQRDLDAARRWGDLLRQRFPKTAQSDEVDKALYHVAAPESALPISPEALRIQIAVLDRFGKANPGNRYTADAERRRDLLRTQLAGVHAEAAARRAEASRILAAVGGFDLARSVANSIDDLFAQVQAIDKIEMGQDVRAQVQRQLGEAEAQWRTHRDQVLAEATKLGVQALGLMPPPLRKAFILPTDLKDQYGNPVVQRAGSWYDPTTGWPYEVWLKEPRMEFVLIPAVPADPKSKGQTGEMKPFYMGKYETT